MIISSYDPLDPNDTPFGNRFRQLAGRYRHRISRLIGKLESFVVQDTRYSCLAAPSGGGDVEIYLVPPRYELRPGADAAALVRVDHRRKTIELIDIYESYGGSDEPEHWQRAVADAQAAIGC